MSDTVKAFKEWAVVCEALLDGRQQIILRKGGIAEGRKGFAFRYKEFFLMPTQFHEQVARTTLPSDSPLPPPPAVGTLVIPGFCRVVASGLVTDKDALDQLAPYHILSEDTVTERFGYGAEQGVHIAFVRAFRIDPVWTLADSPAYGGCRSWVDLPPAPDCQSTPAVSEATHASAADILLGLPGLHG